MSNPHYKIWGNRLYASQVPIDTYIDFLRCWKSFGTVNSQQVKYKKNENIFARLLVFEDYLPDEIWKNQNEKFSDLLKDENETLILEFHHYLFQKNKKCFNKIEQVVEGDTKITVGAIQTMLKLFLDIRVSNSNEVTSSKERLQWWAQYFPPFSMNMFSMEIHHETGNPFKLASFKRNFQARTGEIIFQLLGQSSDSMIIDSAIRSTYESPNVFGSFFDIVDSFATFLFTEKSNLLKERVVNEYFHEDLDSLIEDVIKNPEDKPEELGEFPDLGIGEIPFVDIIADSFSKIMMSGLSIDQKIAAAGQYFTFSAIKYLIWRAKTELEVADIKPYFLFCFKQIDQLRPLRALSHLCLSLNLQFIRDAFDSHSSVNEPDAISKSAIQAFNRLYLPFLSARGKGLGLVHPRTGRHQHFNMTESFLRILVTTCFEKQESILPINEFMDRMYLREGIVLAHTEFLQTAELRSFHTGDPDIFHKNKSVFCEQLKGMGLLVESSDQGQYVQNPN
jgi:hypothetical protein